MGISRGENIKRVEALGVIDAPVVNTAPVRAAENFRYPPPRQPARVSMPGTRSSGEGDKSGHLVHRDVA